MGRNGTTQTIRRKRFEAYLDTLIRDGTFGTQGEIAAECGITDALLSKVLIDPNRRLSVESCLRLARRLNEYPAVILRAAGRDDAAEIVEALWPRDREDRVVLTRSEREVVKEWRQLTMTDRHHLMALISICAERARARTVGPNGRVKSDVRALRPRRPTASTP